MERREDWSRVELREECRVYRREAGREEKSEA